MSERYKPHRLIRERAAQIALGAPDHLAVPPPNTRKVHLPGSRPVYYCNHDKPWKDCLICSKPKVG